MSMICTYESNISDHPSPLYNPLEDSRQSHSNPQDREYFVQSDPTAAATFGILWKLDGMSTGLEWVLRLVMSRVVLSRE